MPETREAVKCKNLYRGIKDLPDGKTPGKIR